MHRANKPGVTAVTSTEVGSHIELKRNGGASALQTSSWLDRSPVATRSVLTVTSTTLLPSLACLATNSLTVAASCSRVGGGSCVAKYSSAENVVASVCIGG
jgi:hypothetical protein